MCVKLTTENTLYRLFLNKDFFLIYQLTGKSNHSLFLYNNYLISLFDTSPSYYWHEYKINKAWRKWVLDRIPLLSLLILSSIVCNQLPITVECGFLLLFLLVLVSFLERQGKAWTSVNDILIGCIFLGRNHHILRWGATTGTMWTAKESTRLQPFIRVTRTNSNVFWIATVIDSYKSKQWKVINKLSKPLVLWPK